MSRQYFADVLLDPPVVNPAPTSPIVATTESAMWGNVAGSNSGICCPINVGDARAGKIYQAKAGGIYSTAASGTLTITPRIGISATAATNITLGASGAQTVPVSVSGVPWYLQFTLVIRSIGLAGANSIAFGNGFFTGTGTVATAGTALSFAFGGTSCSFDASVQEALWMGWTLSVAGSCTPEWVTWQSLN